jgi:copper chaperone CopZ
MNFIKSFLLAFAILAISVNLAFSQSSTSTQENATFITSTVKVKGITCAKDLAMISDNVEKLKGVDSCEVVKQGATSKFSVKFDPSLLKEEDIHAAIERTGSCENPNERPYKVKL